MTLHRARTLTVSCDACPETFPREYNLESFNDLMADLRDSGWRSRKVEGIWTHECPYCAKRSAGRLL